MTHTSKASGFSADTEILTRRGWLTFDQLAGDDEVATRSPEGLFEWQRPTDITWRPYEGDMVWLHSRTTDLMVMPEHRILYRNQRTGTGKRFVKLSDGGGVEAIGRAADFVGRRASLIATSRWEPASTTERFTLAPTSASRTGRRPPGKPPKHFTASATDFAAFMGMYLSEGFIAGEGPGEYPIVICQSQKGNGFREYQELLDRILGRHLPWRPSGSGTWCFRNKALYEYLETCGKYAWGKVIPPEILDLPVGHLETFWHYYWIGDGSLMASTGRKDIQVVQTSSRAAIDRFQEILQKLGHWSPINQVTKLYPGIAATRHALYRVNRRAGVTACARTVEVLPYDGMLGCIHVPNDMVYVRRADRPVWAGSA